MNWWYYSYKVSTLPCTNVGWLICGDIRCGLDWRVGSADGGGVRPTLGLESDSALGLKDPELGLELDPALGLEGVIFCTGKLENLEPELLPESEDFLGCTAGWGKVIC